MTDGAASGATRGQKAGRGWTVLAWLPGYRLGWLRFDLIAGLTVCGILVPEGRRRWS